MSRKISIHQLPKSPGYLQHWIARPGCVWVQSDIASLEQVVLAELSEDASLMKLYGPKAKPNQCVYLYNGANFPGIQDKIRTLYDPDNPPATAEELEEIKHKLKGPRSIAKKATLGFSYGMGAGKLQREFQLIGVSMTWKEADAMVQAYRKLYAGVATWNAKLEAEWKDRGGWVYNGLARPIAVSQAYVKDLVNRVVQSTGHDVTMRFIYYISKLRDASRLHLSPIIVDFHDETIWECPEEEGPAALALIEEALRLTNKELAGIIPIRSKPELIHCLAESKCENFKLERNAT